MIQPMGTMSEVMDALHPDYLAVDNYPQDESAATIAAREYQAELEERAANGDKFAISVLTTGLPGDEAE